MHDQRIAKETHILAKSKGFKINICYCGGFPDCICHDERPSQSLLQKWLREQLEIDVNVLAYASSPRKYFVSTYTYFNGEFMGEVLNTTNIYDKSGNKTRQRFFKTYEDALEYGLIEGLNTRTLHNEKV